MKSVYIHIPFCKHKCLYCDFNSYDNKDELIREYFDALIKEIKSYEFNEELNTIYIGGGTPSFVDEKYIEKILTLIPKAKEVTLEANPGTLNEEKLITYKKVGINRISMGLQAMQNNILKEIGRIHTLEEFEKSYNAVRKVSFDNVNIDLMHGLPNQRLSDFKESVDYLVRLNPEHISCYSLIIHNNIFRNLPSDEEEREMYYYAKNKLKENGYVHYEISNFSKPGKESKHNLVYWNQEEYIGFGAGASSYINGKRFTNLQKLEDYIKRINNNENVNIIDEIQDDEAKLNEYIILKLRLIDGFNIEEINSKFNINVLEKLGQKFEKLEKLGLINIGKNIRLSERGLDLANIVWEEFV